MKYLNGNMWQTSSQTSNNPALKLTTLPPLVENASEIRVRNFHQKNIDVHYWRVWTKTNKLIKPVVAFEQFFFPTLFQRKSLHNGESIRRCSTNGQKTGECWDQIVSQKIPNPKLCTKQLQNFIQYFSSSTKFWALVWSCRQR